jgi:hypothetical protein
MVHLRSLPSEEPATSIGWVQWMWPEIQAGLATGKKLKEVWEAAQRDGLHISYSQFRVYVSRIRRREQRSKSPTDKQELKPSQSQADSTTPTRGSPVDPLYNIRVQLEKKRQSHFDYNPFPDPKDSMT